MPDILASLRNNRLSSDIAWTALGFFFLASSGVIINLSILSIRDATSLGVFNQAYAVYIIASQFAVGGLHYSALRSAASGRPDAEEWGAVLGSALFPGVILGVLVGIVLWLLAPFLGRLLDSPDAGRSVAIMGLAMPLFASSKILLGFLNGLRHMRALSVLQSVRYIVLTLGVVAFSAADLESWWMAAAFPIAELITTCCALTYIIGSGAVRRVRGTRNWIDTHVSFSLRAFASGVLTEANSKIDVLMAGFFLSDHLVGVYSFVSMLFEGLLQLLSVMRMNFNPILVTAISTGDWATAMSLRTLTAKIVFPLSVLLAFVSLGLLYAIATWVFPSRGLEAGFPAGVLLFAGFAALSVVMPFDNLLLLNGFPGHQSLQLLTVTAAGLVAGACLVPIFGVTGAAAGLIAGYFGGAAYLVVVARCLFGWNLVTNSKRVKKCAESSAS